jgi:hypothetical protein
MQMTAKEQAIRMTRGGRKPVAPGTRTPDWHVAGSNEARLNVTVLFTSVDATIAALRTAGALAGKLGGRITIMVPEIVPYHLPINKPPVAQDWNEKRFRVIAAESPVETSVRFYLCRDMDEMLARQLKPHSLIVLGGKKHWWPTRESRLASRLRSCGHEVILAETE